MLKSLRSVTPHLWPGPLGTLIIAAITILLVLWSPPSTRAQAQGQTPSYRLIMTPQRVAAFVEAAARDLNYLPGEVVIKFRAGVTRTGQQRALQALRSRPSVDTLRWSGSAAVLSDRSEPDPRVLAATLQRQPEVAYAGPNHLLRARSTPNDPGFDAYQWNLRTLDMPRAWDVNPGGSPNVIVAVVDSGVTETNATFTMPTWNGSAIQNIAVPYATNPDLAASRLTQPIDLVFWDGPVLDMDGHGTHVSSTIGEDTNNGKAEAGVAYNVKIMPVKACLGFWDVQFLMAMDGVPGFPPLDAGSCPEDAIAAGVEDAANNGAKVINLSLGGDAPAPLILDAIRFAVNRGVFVAISAGNAYEDGNPVEYPAAYAATINGAMSVGAVGPSKNRAYYSGTASGTEIAAPGGSIRENGLLGLVWQSTLVESDLDPETVLFPRFNRYIDTPLQGTSMASPHVAGLAALLVSQGVSKPAAIEALIKATALDLGPRGRDDEYGYGLIQPRAAVRGFGLITK